jgi:exosortase/archaeosortase
MNYKNIILFIIGAIELSIQIFIAFYRYIEQKNKSLKKNSDKLINFSLWCVISIFIGYLIDSIININVVTEKFYSIYALTFNLLFFCLYFLYQGNILAFNSEYVQIGIKMYKSNELKVYSTKNTFMNRVKVTFIYSNDNEDKKRITARMTREVYGELIQVI